ncbi:MAG: hypothetical protein IKZ20_03210, partial [Bacteroidaceae bacterium]|nr:hypothetical protein [Bacteroidaceae bacterium]
HRFLQHADGKNLQALQNFLQALQKNLNALQKIPLALPMNCPHCAIIPDGNFSPEAGEMPFGQRGRKVL